MPDKANSLDDVLGQLEALRKGIHSGSEPDMAALADRLLQLAARLEQQRTETQRKIEHLAHNQQLLEARLVPVEDSRLFRALRRAGSLYLNCRTRAGRLLLHSPLHPFFIKLFPPRGAMDPYPAWLETERASAPDRAATRTALNFARRPLVSLVMPVRDPVRAWLEAAVESVMAQSYDHWELCVCDDASRSGWIEEYFRMAADNRIRFVRSEARMGISGAMNRAGQLASGEYVGFLDQDDTLSPFALEHVVDAVQQTSPALIYSDEDQIDTEGKRGRPTFKPDWDPELLTSCMYLGHFLVARRTELDRVGWFRSEFDGSQDYDLVLRLSDRPLEVHHVPRVLYHWRQHEGSTSGNPAAKPYAHTAGRRALAEAVRRRGVPADVMDGEFPTTFRLRRRLLTRPAVTLVICSRSPKLLRRCLRSIKDCTDYEPREIVVVEHKSGDAAAMDRLLRNAGCVRVAYEGPFNFSVMNNRGAQAAHGEVLVFLNDDIKALAPEWLTALVAQLERVEVGVAGALLLYPSGTLQHAGIAVGIMDGAGHPLRNGSSVSHWNWSRMARHVSAVTGACLAIRKSVFDELGGFDHAFPVNYNDVDLCLRAGKAGYDVILEPAARLRHYEAQTRRARTTFRERELLHDRWGTELERGDPFYNPNLTRTSEDASLRLEN